MDLRNVIGLLLLAIGLLLLVAGFTVSPRPESDVLGLNLNMVWGIVLAASGALFVFTSRTRVRKR